MSIGPSQNPSPRSHRKRLVLPRTIAEVLDTALDKAIEVQSPQVAGYVDRLCAAHPQATAPELLRLLERRYLQAVAALGAAAGASAALPGIGTVASVSAAALEITAFVEATTLFALSAARVYGIRNDEPLYLRSLVLGVLVGASGMDIAEQVAGAKARWGEVLARRGSRDSLGRLNSVLARRLVAQVGARQGVLSVGRALPFGIGAGVGAVGNLALARASVAAVRHAFELPS